MDTADNKSLPGPEGELRRRGFALVEQHWPELSRSVQRWLGTAFNEDDGRVGEVALVILLRIADGKGIAPRLQQIPPGDPREKSLLFSNAHFVTAEVIEDARRQRQRRPAPASFPGPRQP